MSNSRSLPPGLVLVIAAIPFVVAIALKAPAGPVEAGHPKAASAVAVPGPQHL